MNDVLETELTEALRRLDAVHTGSVLLVHHNDADGLTSGALLSIQALARAAERG